MADKERILNDEEARAHWQKVGMLHPNTAKVLWEVDVFGRAWSFVWTPEGMCDITSRGSMVIQHVSLVTKISPDGLRFSRLVLGSFCIFCGRKNQKALWKVAP